MTQKVETGRKVGTGCEVVTGRKVESGRVVGAGGDVGTDREESGLSQQEELNTDRITCKESNV